MKLIDSELNGMQPDDLDVDEFTEEDERIPKDYSALFEAPNYADFIKTPPNNKSRLYERRVQSLCKSGMILSLNAGNAPDAATFLKYGPGFSKAAGNLAAEDARVARIVDMLTAPDSPHLMFLMVAMPMISQLARNHQPQIAQVGSTFKERRQQRKQAKLAGKVETPPVTVHIFKREIKLPVRFRIRVPKLGDLLKAFVTPTQYPDEIAAEVFNDPAVIRQLHKMGIRPQDDSSDEV